MKITPNAKKQVKGLIEEFGFTFSPSLGINLQESKRRSY